jgi:uncharacterized protein YgbK (DUF1537 family)
VRLLLQVEAAIACGSSAVIYTSREEIRFNTPAERLAFSEYLSMFLMELVVGLPENIGFLISKGGVTSNDLLSTGLKLSRSRVLVQILAGCPSDHERYPGLPVVIFPGNVGDESSLADAFRILTARPDEASLQRSA